MKKKGQVVILGFMLAVVIIVLALALAFPIRQLADNAMANSTTTTTGMNCSSTTDDFVKAGCYINDINPLFFIGGLIAAAGVVIGARILYG